MFRSKKLDRLLAEAEMEERMRELQKENDELKEVIARSAVLWKYQETVLEMYEVMLPITGDLLQAHQVLKEACQKMAAALKAKVSDEHARSGAN